MIILKITNAQEVIASRFGMLLENFSPDLLDQSAVENELIKQLVVNLRAEGVKGELAALSGMDLSDGKLEVHEELKVRKHQTF